MTYPTFDECEELLSFDLAGLHVDLEGEEEGECVLVCLVQTSDCVLKHLKGHVLYDVSDPLRRDGRLGRPVGEGESHVNFKISKFPYMTSI